MTRAGPIAAGALIQACLLWIALLGDLGHHVPLFILLFGLAFLAYLWAVCHSHRLSVRTVVAFGLLFRLTLLPTEPSLSDDVYRYVWDGRVLAAGINPYRHAPDAPELARLRDTRIHPRINHPHVPTVYPPAAQLFFLACSLVSPTVVALKAALVLVDLSTALFLWVVLRRLGHPPGRLAVYLWSPLLVVEVAGSGHVDALGVAFLACGLAAAVAQRRLASVVWLAGASLSKLMPVVLLPAWWSWASGTGAGPTRGGGRVRAACRFLWPPALFLVLIAAAYWPFAGSDVSVTRGLAVYARTWEFNGLVYGAMRWAGVAGDAARASCAGLLAVVALWMAFRRIDVARAGLWITGAFLALTPTLHPWYAVWLLPFLTLCRSWAWLAFTGLVVLSYVVLIDYVAAGLWQESWWVRPIEAGGGLLVWGGVRLWRARAPRLEGTD